jgi:hypothetical protein
MATQTDHYSFLIRFVIATTICGIIIFLYGMIISNPALYSSVLAVKASLLGGEGIVIGNALPSAPQGLFLFACVLIITGASVDVWMRLHPHLYHHANHTNQKNHSNDPFDYLNHDHVLEEPHMW